jgi:5-methylcytosine-specific restriction endonuclease McrA
MARIRGIKRLKILLSKMFKCEECGKTHQLLIIHHKDFNPFNDDPDNLQLLCPKCHYKKHREAKRGEEEEGAHKIIENDD